MERPEVSCCAWHPCSFSARSGPKISSPKSVEKVGWPSVSFFGKFVEVQKFFGFVSTCALGDPMAARVGKLFAEAVLTVGSCGDGDGGI